jgi:uncharacterized membrane protein
MTVMESGSEILKLDEVGRLRTPPEKREAMLAEYERSGMTGAQFARSVGVRYSTLMYWLQKRRKEALPTIILMAFVTCLTRTGGYLLLRNRALTPRTRTVLEAAPVIAPDFVSKHPADLIALAIALAAATRLPILPTVVIAVTGAGPLRHVMP